MKRISNIIVVSLASVVLIALNGCGTAKRCPDISAYGNLGSVVNTRDDDLSPTTIEDKLYYYSIDKGPRGGKTYFIAVLEEKDFREAKIADKFYFGNLTECETPVLIRDESAGTLEAYFAAAQPGDRSKVKDIYYSRRENGGWTRPQPLSINSDARDAEPCLSDDGKTLIFASDRDGGFGGIDLYLSQKQSDGSWSEPKNLGDKVNTEQNDMSPYLDKNGTLYFASTGYAQNSGFDIIKAKPAGKLKWREGERMPFPFSTEYGEISPTKLGGKFVIASNRPGGCGGFDLYGYEICGPVRLKARVRSDANIPLAGDAYLLSAEGDTLEKVRAPADGKFALTLLPEKKYKLKYINACVPSKTAEAEFEAPCSDSSMVAVRLDINVSLKPTMFSFDYYEIPVFVSGYYKPLTEESLADLKLKFAYNQLGDADSTKYIENPKNNYDEYVRISEIAFQDAAEFILRKIDFLNCGDSATNGKLKIKVYGYADPRPISDRARYVGPVIESESLGISAYPGERINNAFLSELRAYFTARALKKILKKSPKYKANESAIIWAAEGKGADSSFEQTERNRRVAIEAGFGE